jgi:hypothetical protein
MSRSLNIHLEKGAATAPFCDRVMDLCSRLCDMGQKLKSGNIPWKKAAKIEKSFVTELSSLCNRRFASNLPRPSEPISQVPSRDFSLQDWKADSKPTASFPVCYKPPEDKASIQGSSCKPSSLQIRQRLKRCCITIQAEVSMASD